MATPFSNVNLTAMNKKQLRQIARNVNVAPVTEHNSQTTAAALVTAIKAK